MVYLPTPTWCFAGKWRETYTCHTSILWDEVGPLKGPFYFCFRSRNLVVKYIIPISVYHSNTITARDYKGMMVVNSPLKRPYLMEMVAFGVVPWDFHFITISMAMALGGAPLHDQINGYEPPKNHTNPTRQIFSTQICTPALQVEVESRRKTSAGSWRKTCVALPLVPCWIQKPVTRGVLGPSGTPVSRVSENPVKPIDFGHL